MDEIPLKPIFLFADSQLLFWRPHEDPFLNVVRRSIDAVHPKAAYLGASNGDDPQFYELFTSAMETVSIDQCRMIPSNPDDAAREFLKEADVILLAGGDVRVGWNAILQAKLNETLIDRYANGAVLIGISAGAMQLGKRAWGGDMPTDETLFPTLKLVPSVISVHEDEDWAALREAVRLSGGTTLGVGIPRGGGIIYYPEHVMEPIRHAVHEIFLNDEEMSEAILMPGETAGPEIIDRQGVPPDRKILN